MSCSPNYLPTSQTILSAASSLAATLFIVKVIADDLVPDAVSDYVSSCLRAVSARLNSQLTVVIEEVDGLTPNHMFHAANLYLATRMSRSTRRIKVAKPEKEPELQVTIDKNQEVLDSFKGVKFRWIMVSNSFDSIKKQNAKKGSDTSKSEIRCFELTFHRRHKDMVLSSYLPEILRRAKEIEEEKRVVKLHTIDYHGKDNWGSISLNHPATFDTIAMNPELKACLIDDLDRFLVRKEYYRKVGRAWKRGYLLEGPPGTGKSSLVAAMANYLKFDIYDLDLKEVDSNSELRKFLIGTGSRSIIVIEDIDCLVGLQNRQKSSDEEDKVSLSGLLNIIDGLWSSCGDERIIVFTTNHKEHLDPALLRPGRMDLHLHMSYCTYRGFLILASNYLGIQDHPLFRVVEELLEEVQVTPAEVAGELMKNDSTEIALKGLVKFIQSKQQIT